MSWVTDSVKPRERSAAKRRRLTTAAMRVLWERGVERTTLADIAAAAKVPTGNVYYYFKTKDALVRAALDQQTDHFAALTARLAEHDDPADRLKGLVQTWIDGRDQAVRHGCPTGTLAAELGKRGDTELAAAPGALMRRLLDWVARQFQELGAADPEADALTLIAGYQGMSMLANALRDTEIMTREGRRLQEWIDTRSPVG